MSSDQVGDDRLELEVSTTEALNIAPDTGGRGTRIWWALAVALLVGSIVAALRVGDDSPTARTSGTVTTAQAAPTSAPSPTLSRRLMVGDVVEAEVASSLPYDVAVLDDAHRLWVLHPAEGTATYRGLVEMDQISPVGVDSPPQRPTLNVSDSGWLLVGGTFGTVTVNPQGQHILTAHAGAEPVSWDGTESRTYTWWPDLGTVHVEYDGGAGWLTDLIRVGPMDRRIIVAANEGSFLIEDDAVTLLTRDHVLDANQRFFVTRSTDGELTIAELGSTAPVGVVSPTFLTAAEAANVVADPDLQVSLAPDARTVALLDPFHLYIVDVASGVGRQVSLTRRLDPYGTTLAAWDPLGQVVTWVVDGEIRVLDLDRRSAILGPTIGNDGPIAIGTPVAAVAFPPETTG